VFGFGLGSCLGSFLCCDLFIGGIDYGTCGGICSFGLGLWLVRFFCSNLFISGIDYYTRHEGFRLQRVYIFLVIELWEIAHAVFLQLLACKEPPCDGAEAQ
jgi:hypothetical protein